MTDINNLEAANNALKPVPAKNIQNYREEIDLAQLMAKASVLPKHLHGNAGNCLAVITLAQTWNLNPIMVGLKTSVIPNKRGGETLMFEGQLVQAVINKSAMIQGRLKFEISGQGKDTKCIVSGRIASESEDRVIEVCMPTIQNSPLWSGSQSEKEQQLTYLASRMWCRRYCPEILLGVYTPEDGFEQEKPRTDLSSLDDDVIENQPVQAITDDTASNAINTLSLEDEPERDLVVVETPQGPAVIQEGKPRCEICQGKGYVVGSEVDGAGVKNEYIEPCQCQPKRGAR